MDMGWNAQTAARLAIPVLAAAATALIIAIRQRRDGAVLHGANALSASLIHRALGPAAAIIGCLIGLAMTGTKVNGRLAGVVLAIAFSGGGLYLIYYSSLRRIAWTASEMAIWTPLAKWRAIGFEEIVALEYSRWKHELVVIAHGAPIGVPDSFHGFEGFLADLSRARPDLFGGGGEDEHEFAADAAPAFAAAPQAAR